MTTLRLKEVIRDWIQENAPDHPVLEGLPIIINGETKAQTDAVENETDAHAYPLIGIIDTGSEVIEQNGVVMHGVYEIGIKVELHSVPVDQEEGGTGFDDFSAMENDLSTILMDQTILQWAENRERLRLFDFRPASPIVEPRDGRRVSVIEISCKACTI